MAAGRSSATARRMAQHTASGTLVWPGTLALCEASRNWRYSGSASTRSTMRFMMRTASSGNLPLADSADSITASAPS
jgi:hypothetical protein